jgi:L-serine dehydratase
MEDIEVIGNQEPRVGTCTPKGCGSCGPAPRKNETPAALSRREFGHAVLAASASALLTGCSSQKNAEPGDGSAPAPPALSPDLAVVQTSKGPIMTALDEFYKIGPGPQFPHHGADGKLHTISSSGFRLPEDQLQRATALSSFIWRPECDG